MTRKVALLILILNWNGVEGDNGRKRRGFGSYADMNNGQRQMTFDYLNQNQNIALWSAQSAVTSSVGQVYGVQQAMLADAVREFVTPKKGHPGHQGQRSHYSKASRYQTPYRYELEPSQSSHPSPEPPSHTPRPQRGQRGSGDPETDPWRPTRKPSHRRRLRRPQTTGNRLISLPPTFPR